MTKKKHRPHLRAHSEAYSELCALLHETATLGSVSSLLHWDQETYMPAAAAPAHAQQSALLATLIHQRVTKPRIGELIAACEGDRDLTAPGAATAANLREMRRDYDLATKLPTELVAEMAQVTSLANHVWKEARAKADFRSFAPWLDKVYGLCRRVAQCYGVPAGGELYDALLDTYEPGMTARQVEQVFAPLRVELSELIGRVSNCRKKVDTRCLDVKVAPADQQAFGLIVLEHMGFDLKAGRLDVTTHPFCSGLGPGDTRLTTRYQDEKFTDALYSIMHEAGHGLYEQGLPKLPQGKKPGLFGQPLAVDISLGIHESQSRMWENFVGRSEQFWRWAQPRIVKSLSGEFRRYKPREFFAAVNTVQPSLIRVEADEATYNLHVLIRFELERALLSGDMPVRDLPAAWNQRYKKYLGIDVPDDRRGCLQDVHWSSGSIGYFPTYTLGNLYAAQFWEKILEDMPDLPKRISKGQFLELKEWLNRKIHVHGKRYRAAELCQRITGKELSTAPLMRHLTSKASAVYCV